MEVMSSETLVTISVTIRTWFQNPENRSLIIAVFKTSILYEQ